MRRPIRVDPRVVCAARPGSDRLAGAHRHLVDRWRRRRGRLAVGYLYSIAAGTCRGRCGALGCGLHANQFDGTKAVHRIAQRRHVTARSTRRGATASTLGRAQRVCRPAAAGHPKPTAGHRGKAAPVSSCDLWLPAVRGHADRGGGVSSADPLGQPAPRSVSWASSQARFYFSHRGWHRPARAPPTRPTPGREHRWPPAELHHWKPSPRTRAWPTARLRLPRHHSERRLGGRRQVYNAAFSPDGTVDPPHLATTTTDPAHGLLGGGQNWFHEDDQGPSLRHRHQLSAMRYTLYRVNTNFIRSKDVLLSQLTVYRSTPASGAPARRSTRSWATQGRQDVDPQYAGASDHMLIYHNWVDVTSYAGQNDGGLVNCRRPALANYLSGGAPGAEPPAARRPMDNGAASPPQRRGAQGVPVRTVNGDLNKTNCASCEVALERDLFFTPSMPPGRQLLDEPVPADP